MQKKLKIAVGLSGGVDSSVCAALLRRAGHDVVGVAMKLWRGDLPSGVPRGACFGPGASAGLARAEAVAGRLGVGFVAIDCLDEFERGVLDDFRREYLAGRTPSPCVLCNRLIKFGALPRLARAAGVSFDFFATGHYARVSAGPGGRFRLYKGIDAAKDQSYFLHRLTQEQLSRVMFPLGGMTKAEVRGLARELGLASLAGPESRDFCGGAYADFVGGPSRPGVIVDRAGRVLGTHRGYWRYTIGQRKGLGVAAAAPLYVVAIDAARNEVVVGPARDVVRRVVRLSRCNWIAPAVPCACEARIRSSARGVRAFVRRLDGGTAELEFPDGVASPAPGQSAALYRGDEVLGGGVIDEVFG